MKFISIFKVPSDLNLDAKLKLYCTHSPEQNAEQKCIFWKERAVKATNFSVKQVYETIALK